MAHRSLWLREALDGAPPAPPLAGAQRADIAILGGGYVGLWTAIQLKQREPGCDVVVLERDICGGGASGRNGGMMLSWWPKLASLIKLCGTDEALGLARASADAIDDIAAFCAANAIDCDLRRGGFLWTATTPAHIGAWDAVVNLCEQYGVGAFERLPADEVARRSGSDRHIAGVFEARAATVQPAKLARGLRAAALRLGVRIHEGTPALDFTRERPLVIQTPDGTLTADKLVVATNAWAAALPELRRALVVVSSDIVATAPIPDRLAEIGWTGGEGITDSQMMVAYYRTTADGRIAFGKGTAGVTYRGRVGELFDRDAARSAMTAADFRRNYPALADVPIEHDWGGPIDRTPTSVPILGHLGGRMLASLALGVRDEWSVNGLIDRAADPFPPEPIRFLGAQVVREAVIRKERSELAGRPPRPLAVRVAALAPSGLEDKG
jgi:glycine/D-amino acid oxidase-like deaminating enzyme